jgi:hypothetical protein
LLNETTAQSFSNEQVRLLYVRAQVSRIDLKIDLALNDVLCAYRGVVGRAAGTAGVPGAPTALRTAAAVDVCRLVVNCFGVPSLSAETAFEICKANVLDDLGNAFSTFLAEGMTVVGVLASLGLGGMPVFAVPLAVNPLLVVPATMRLFLILAADLILILTRAFREAAVKCVGQPSKRDVTVAAVAYRQHYREVHRRVMALVPRRNIVKSFRIDQIRLGMQAIVSEYKERVTQGIGAGPAVYRGGSVSRLRLSSSTTTLVTDKAESWMDDVEDIKLVSKEIEM